MRAKNVLNRQHDSTGVKGLYVEKYTPSTDRIYSQVLKKYLAFANIQLDADAVVTYVDLAGTLITGAALAKGRHTFPIREVRASTQIVYLVHDGNIAPREVAMTSPIYP